MTANEAILKKLSDLGIDATDELASRLAQVGGNLFRLVLQLVKDFPQQRSKIGRIWGDHLGLAYVDLATTAAHQSAILAVPEPLARANRIFPLYETGGALTIATAHPNRDELLKTLQHATGRMVEFVFSFPDDIDDGIELAYQTSEAIAKHLAQTGFAKLDKPSEVITSEQLHWMAGQESVIQFVRGMLLLAVKEGASDIHLEPGDHCVRIRFRIDGVMQERFTLESKLLMPLVSRLKILAGADISERRRPQDGRMKLELSYRAIDLRFSSVPTIYGEKVVLRILGQLHMRGVPDLNDLQMSTSILNGIKKIIDTPNGVFFVTGPTGSGKSTTLYAILNRLNTPDVNIMTIEDPVELRLEGVNQVQVSHESDLDFAAAIRSFLRQDPDVILVGEIRDAASAKIAAQAALTGHLVMATMHTNNSLQAVIRLIEIGVEPFLVAPSIIAVLAQRLVRSICRHCKESYVPPREILDENFDWDGKTQVLFYRGKGCERCRRTGYLGRIPVHELFFLGGELRTMVARNASIVDIERCAYRLGFKPLRHDGLKKVLRGLTTIDEIDAITYTSEQ